MATTRYLVSIRTEATKKWVACFWADSLTEATERLGPLVLGAMNPEPNAFTETRIERKFQ